ncbi:hypothetical protein [Streptomyces sp. ECR3.8]|uniref:hypothetical protein n=1 Tax=Streptomyces sp. ECR3.8 TaxID=3461009 RepID=UPI004042C298
MKTRTAACAALLTLAALTGCSSSSDGKSDEPSPSSSTKTYSYADCVALLEYDYAEGQPQDASGDPECSHLTRDQYGKAVAEVLTGHKDEILEEASNEAIWDTAWDELDAAAQTSVCDLLLAEGPDTGAAQGVSEEQGQYFLDTKC